MLASDILFKFLFNNLRTSSNYYSSYSISCYVGYFDVSFFFNSLSMISFFVSFFILFCSTYYYTYSSD